MDYYNDNEEKLINITFLPASKMQKKMYDTIFSRITKLTKNKKLDGFESTDITGILDDKVFILYKDPKNINRFCIIFINEEVEKIIHIDSKNINNFINECTYYYEYNTNLNLSIESTGLRKRSKEYCKYKWTNSDKKYTIILRENSDKTYQYEMFLEDKTGKTQIICIWKNYEEFLNEKKPEKIIVNDDMKCICSDFIITSNNSYIAGDSDRTYDEIKKMIAQLGLSLDCSAPRKFITIGVTVNEGIEKIVNQYVLEEKNININKEKVNQEESKTKEKRSKIEHIINKNPKPEENPIIEVDHLTRRNAIEHIKKSSRDIERKIEKK